MRNSGAISAGLLNILLFSLALLNPVRGTFLVETSSLTVTSPDSVKGHYDSAIGNFGMPQYGGTMSGTVVYPSRQADGCTAFTESFKKSDKTGGRPVFALVDRGGNFIKEPLLCLIFNNSISVSIFCIFIVIESFCKVPGLERVCTNLLCVLAKGVDKKILYSISHCAMWSAVSRCSYH